MRDSRTRALLAGASPPQPQPTLVYRLAPSGPAPLCSKVSLSAAALSPNPPGILHWGCLSSLAKQKRAH